MTILQWKVSTLAKLYGHDVSLSRGQLGILVDVVIKWLLMATHGERL